MKVCIVLGTRPEIIKMSPVVRQLIKRGTDFFILHTGQHYSYLLDKVFFEQLGLPAPKYNLDVGSSSHGEETGKMLGGIEKVLILERPDVVLVQGDTNTVLAGALAAAKLHIAVGHIEAGLRSYDRRMPEEINRVLTDHCSDMLFAPTEKARAILIGEGIPGEKITVTGNTIVDAIVQNIEIAKEQSRILEKLHFHPRKYFLVTLHRQENVDNQERLASILQGIQKAVGTFNLPALYPAHPRSRKMMTQFGIQPRGIQIIEPLDFLNFLVLEANARLIFTDSGGVQEEACILRVPCVTLRDNTERPETLEIGANIIGGVIPEKILESCRIMLRNENGWENPFGDGKASERIVSNLERCCCARLEKK
jgi:UDP-N-acetylglucosamine 2-epimerase (non-hydrolysing)